MKTFLVVRGETYITMQYVEWERFLANRYIDRVISRQQERAARSIAELLYLLMITNVLVGYDDYA